MKVFIYGLHCPVAGTIRYVGKSVSPSRRFRAHISAAIRGVTDHHTARWIRALHVEGMMPELILLSEVRDGERWQQVERDFIATAESRGWHLTNTTSGGEGLDYRDDAAKARYAESQRAATLRAREKYPHLVDALAEASRRVANDPEIVARRSESIRMAYTRDDVRARNEAARLEVSARPEVKAAIGAATRAAWQRPEYREKIESTLKSPEFAAAQSERLKARWEDPDAREKMNGARWTPEKRAAQAEVIRQRSTPEYRAMMAEKTRAVWAKRKATA